VGTSPHLRLPRVAPRPPPAALRLRELGMRELDSTIKIRISSAQAERWRREARARGESVSELVRAALFGRAIHRVPEINQQAWQHLAAAAANLNQLSHRLNQAALAGASQLAAVASADAAEVAAALAEFRARLIGAEQCH
jgi:hypothetical protein